MKKHFISIISLMCAAMFVAAVAKAQDSDMKKHQVQWKQLNDEVEKVYKEGHYQEGISLAEKAYQYAMKNFGKAHKNTLTSMNKLARLYELLGRYGEAEPLDKEALHLSEKVLGKKHPYYMTFANNLGLLYRSQGRYGEAEPLLRETLQLKKEVLGKEHPATLISIDNLALLYQSQKRFEEAEPLHKEALQLSEKVLGKDHPDTLISLDNLALLYLSQERYGEAEPLYKKLLQLYEKVLGKEHPDTLMSINNLAGFYTSQERYGEAEPLYEELLQLREKVLGKEHPDTLISINNLAGLYKSQGRYGEAEPLYKKSFQLLEKVLGKEHPITLKIQLNNIGLMINMEKVLPAFQQIKSMEYLLLSRSFHELYTTSQERVRRMYLKNILEFQNLSFFFALKYPEVEYQQLSANIMLRWKNVYAEENSFQYRLLNISHDSDTKKLKMDLSKLKTEFSLKIHHNTGKRDASTIWRDLLSTEYVLREKARHNKNELQVSTANLDQIIEHLPQNSALIEFRMFQEADFKTGKLGKLHLAYYLLLSDAPQQLLFEDLGEVESLKKIAESKEKPELPYQALFGKFDKHIRNLKKIYIAPDGFLNLVPFHALRLPDGKYWTERQQINILQTGRDLLSPSLANPSKLFVAVGGVDYGDMPKQTASAKGSDAPPMLNMRAAGELGTGLKYLENSLFEAKTIEDMFKENYPDGKTLVLQGNDATEAALRNLTQAPKILHLSTHGFYLETPQKKTEEWSEEEPLLLSGLALSGANRGLKGMTDDKGDDGLLYSIEVLSMNLQGTELVSLSACDTGKGVTDYSEGVYGLVRALRTAGAQNVLMTLSPVGDKSTREFMEKFYDIYLSSEGKLAPSEALHQTHLYFISHPNPEYRSPEIWGPYVMVGR